MLILLAVYYTYELIQPINQTSYGIFYFVRDFQERNQYAYSNLYGAINCIEQVWTKVEILKIQVTIFLLNRTGKKIKMFK